MFVTTARASSKSLRAEHESWLNDSTIETGFRNESLENERKWTNPGSVTEPPIIGWATGLWPKGSPSRHFSKAKRALLFGVSFALNISRHSMRRPRVGSWKRLCISAETGSNSTRPSGAWSGDVSRVAGTRYAVRWPSGEPWDRLEGSPWAFSSLRYALPRVFPPGDCLTANAAHNP